MKDTIKTELIENFLQENDLSKRQFCKLCNIHYSTLQKILSNDFNFAITALFKISRVIKIPVHKMFN